MSGKGYDSSHSSESKEEFGLKEAFTRGFLWNVCVGVSPK